jgi:hypothetical protein
MPASASFDELRRNVMRIRKQALALGVTAAAALAVAGPARAGTFVCVPATAGAAVTSGGSSGSCASGTTTVELPSSQHDQQTLIKILPYISFEQYLDGHTPVSGVTNPPAHPTIVVHGANVQVVKTRGATAADGTGNLVVGQAGYLYDALTGSENLVVGRRNSWSGSGNLIAGESNNANGSYNVVGGIFASASGTDGTVLGFNSRISAGQYGVAIGHNATVSADRGEAIGTKQSATSADQSTIGSPNHHWAKFSGANKLVAASEQPTAYYAYGAYGYDYVQFKGVDPATCAITVTAQSVGTNYGNISAGYYLYGTYILAYAKDGANNWAGGTPLDVTADCPQGTYAPAN